MISTRDKGFTLKRNHRSLGVNKYQCLHCQSQKLIKEFYLCSNSLMKFS